MVGKERLIRLTREDEMGQTPGAHRVRQDCTCAACEDTKALARDVARLTRERDEARAQLDRVRKLVEKWRAEVVEYPAVSSWGADVAQSAVSLCASELEAILSDALDAALAAGEIGEGK